jgi:nucleotide-binding universal stress UspA family protein
MPEPPQYSLSEAAPDPCANPAPINPFLINPSLILVATDLSDLGRLMPFALEQAAETGARLLLLHVLATGASAATDTVGMPYYDPASALEFARKALEPCCALAGRQKIECDALVREGHPAHQIATVIRQFHADRVLLGTHSRSRLGKLLLGSVAEQVLRSVNLPVITVGPQAHVADRAIAAPGERVVLHATTLKPGSRASAELACRLAAKQGARLLLLHVLPALPGSESLEGSQPEAGQSGQAAGLDSAALHALSRLASEMEAAQQNGPCCPAIVPHVVHGNPSIEILAAAAEYRADLIVLGATDRSAFANLTRDRTIYRVLAHARCPVMTLREAQAVPVAGEMRRTVLHLKGQTPVRDV